MGSRKSQTEVLFDDYAEVAVLACLILPSLNGARDTRGLRPEHFYRPAHQKIFRALQELAGAGHAIDSITVSDHLKAHGTLEEVGGSAFIHSLTDAHFSPVGLKEHAAIVRGYAQRREEIRIARDLEAGLIDADAAVVALRGADLGGTSEIYSLPQLDWRTLIREGVPEVEFVDKPYLPRGARIWIWGPTGSLKSLWSMSRGAHLSRQGIRVSYFSEENPVREELRRLSKIRPDPERFRMFHRTGMDLLDPLWIKVLLEVTRGDDLVFLDSWTDLWSGDEGDNRAAQQFDATVLKPLQAQGVTPVTLHHTGHKQVFSERGGATAGRGASSLGQKADVTLEFKPAGEDMFTIVYGKCRIGGLREPNRTFQSRNTEDGGLEIVEVASSEERAIEELVEKMVQAILIWPVGFMTTTELRLAVGGKKDRQTQALGLLESDPRIHVGIEKVQTGRGRRDAKVWRPVGEDGNGDWLPFTEADE